MAMPHRTNLQLAGPFDPTTSAPAPPDRCAVGDRWGLRARAAIVRSVRACVGHAAGRLGSAAGAIRWPARGEDVLHRFADFMGEPHTAFEIESTLVRLARELSVAERVQL